MVAIIDVYMARIFLFHHLPTRDCINTGDSPCILFGYLNFSCDNVVKNCFLFDESVSYFNLKQKETTLIKHITEFLLVVKYSEWCYTFFLIKGKDLYVYVLGMYIVRKNALKNYLIMLVAFFGSGNTMLTTDL